MPGPLQGIRILDLSNVVSGPMAVQILADQGADVIKVEQPHEGDIARQAGSQRGGVSALFTVLNRNKRSIVLDLHQASAKEVMFDLVKTADVLVENFRPGAMERMDLGYKGLSELNADLIYVSINGFGADGPYSNRRVYDPVIQGITGYVSTQTVARSETPDLVKNIVCDKATALTASQAITAALFARERGSGGQHVEVAMLDAGLSFLWPDGMWNHTFLGDGIEPMPRLSDIYRVTKTMDGYITYLTVSNVEWCSMCRAINREELGLDPKFATLASRLKNIDKLGDILDAELGKWRTDEICRRLDAEEVPFAKVNSLDEVADDPQIRHRNSIREMEHEHGGTLRLPNPPARFGRTPSEIRYLSPMLGQHTDQILAELGRSEAEIANLRAAGAVE